MAFRLPEPLRAFFAHFPLYTYPAILPPSKGPLENPTLWILAPHEQSNLSSDVECLKWQAYMAIRGMADLAVRWDIAPEGALDGKFPNLQVPSPDTPTNKGKLLAAQFIPSWVDEKVGASTDPLEGYRNEAARDESHAWVALLEGRVHPVLVCVFYLTSLLLIEINARSYYPNPREPFFR
jgi:metaxin